MIDRLAESGMPVDVTCRALGVPRQGCCYRYKRRPLSATVLWLTGLVREVHRLRANEP